MSFGYAELFNGLAMEMFSSMRYLVYGLRSNIEAIHFGKGSLLVDMDVTLLMELKKFNEMREFLPFHDVVNSATALTVNQVLFCGSRRQIYVLDKFLRLIVPCYTEFPWNQVFRMNRVNLTLMAAIAKEIVGYMDGRECQNLHLSEKILSQKERILAEYHAWNQLIDPNGLGQPSFEAFNDLFSNIEFHEKRDGKFGLFHLLPNEMKFIIIKKASDMPPTSLDSTGRTFTVLYGNIIEEDRDYDYDLLMITSGKKGVEKGENYAQANRRRHEMENALDYY